MTKKLSKAYNLTKKDINKYVKNKPGVYHICCYNGKKAVIIRRLLHKDKQGILSIGQSSDLNKRLKDFIRGKERGLGHSSGNRYYYFRLGRINKLGKYQLKFKIKCCQNRKIKLEEGKLLVKYWKKFGELPPLNNQEPQYSILKKLGCTE